MASTVTAATLTVAVAESLTLDNRVYDKTTTTTIASIKNVSSRIYSVPATTTLGVASLLSSPTASQFDTENTKYIRITNLDDTAELIVSLGMNATNAALDLKPATSLPLFSVNANGAGSKGAITSIDDIEEIYVHNATSSAVDVEVFIAGV